MLNLWEGWRVAAKAVVYRLLYEEEGLETVEYALLILLIIVVAATAVGPLGERIVSAFNQALVP